MFLRIPTSMIIPEILERLEDADFQDFLTAVFIENASQLPLQNLSASNGYPATVGCADIWMVEITERTGKVWNGKFQIEFAEECNGNSNAMPRTERRYGELRFALDTESAEIILKTDGESETRTKQQDF
jgi:hypothetical protein